MHPHLDFDLMRAQIDALHKRGINAPIYLSAGWDELAAREHPGWRVVTPEGELIRQRGTPHRRRLGVPRFRLALSRLSLPPGRGGDGDLSRRRRHLHRHLLRARLGRAPGRRRGWRSRGSTGPIPRIASPSPSRPRSSSSSGSARRSASTTRSGRSSSISATSAAAAATSSNTSPTSRSNRCRPPSGATSTFPVSARYVDTLGIEFLGMTGKFHHRLGRGRRLQEAGGAPLRMRRDAGAGRPLLDRRPPPSDRRASTRRPTARSAPPMLT